MCLHARGISLHLYTKSIDRCISYGYPEAMLFKCLFADTNLDLILNKMANYDLDANLLNLIYHAIVNGLSGEVHKELTLIIVETSRNEYLNSKSIYSKIEKIESLEYCPLSADTCKIQYRLACGHAFSRKIFSCVGACPDCREPLRFKGISDSEHINLTNSLKVNVTPATFDMEYCDEFERSLE